MADEHKAAQAVTSPPKATPPATEDAPDPEEDNLDDLDDILDEFSTTKPDSKPDAPSSSGPGRPAAPPTSSAPTDTNSTTDDFTDELQAQMATLMSELDSSPEMQDRLSAMVAELAGTSNGTLEPPPTANPSTTTTTSKNTTNPSPAPPADDAFQETILKTMSRMQTSSSNATAAAATTTTEDDLLAQMLKEMQATGLDPADGAGPGDEEEFSKMLMGMMEQLTNKEILYEPMKELHDKFPAWMERSRGKVAEEDWKRYEVQRGLVGEIVERFERKGYSDANVGDREYIVERMQKMQAAGSPPPDLVGDMKDAQEVLGDLDAGCAQQ